MSRPLDPSYVDALMSVDAHTIAIAPHLDDVGQIAHWPTYTVTGKLHLPHGETPFVRGSQSQLTFRLLDAN